MVSPWTSDEEASWLESFYQNRQPYYQEQSYETGSGYVVQETYGQGTVQGGQSSHFNGGNNNVNSINNRGSSQASHRIRCEVPGCPDREGFTRRGDLIRHIGSVHQGPRKYHCGCCMFAAKPYSTPRKDHLKQHIRKKHKKDGEVQWCSIDDCGVPSSIQLGFSSKRCLAEHGHGYHDGRSTPAYQAAMGKF